MSLNCGRAALGARRAVRRGEGRARRDDLFRPVHAADVARAVARLAVRDSRFRHVAVLARALSAGAARFLVSSK